MVCKNCRPKVVRLTTTVVEQSFLERIKIGTPQPLASSPPPIPVDSVSTMDAEIEEISQPETPASPRQGLLSGLLFSPLQSGLSFTLEHGRFITNFLCLAFLC